VPYSCGSIHILVEQSQIAFVRFPEKVEHVTYQRDGTDQHLEQDVIDHQHLDRARNAGARCQQHEITGRNYPGQVADAGDQTHNAVEADANAARKRNRTVEQTRQRCQPVPRHAPFGVGYLFVIVSF
jgi:hypothetical protein